LNTPHCRSKALLFLENLDMIARVDDEAGSDGTRTRGLWRDRPVMALPA
jgi:hypothetical protein